MDGQYDLYPGTILQTPRMKVDVFVYSWFVTGSTSEIICQLETLRQFLNNSVITVNVSVHVLKFHFCTVGNMGISWIKKPAVNNG